MTHDTDLPAVGDTLDDFLLIEELGRGSFATVFLARQRSMQRTVALKVSEDASEEGRTLAQFDHPHIVRVFDQRPLPERGLKLLYMEVVSAGTLDDVITRVQDVAPSARRGSLLLEVIDQALAKRGLEPPEDSLLRRTFSEASWPDTVAIMGAHLAEALDHAHSHDVLHRDIKAANVLLAGNGRAKLADFNISFRSAGDVDAEEYLGGSPAYMSPEHIEACNPAHDYEAESLDARSDLFSLGAMLWEILTGELPYETPDPEAGGLTTRYFDDLLVARRSNVPSPHSLDGMPPHTPRMLRTTLERCFAYDVADRPASARELAYDLRVCRMPDARELMLPDPPRAVRWARSAATLALLVAAIVPNVILSVLNTMYNAGRIVDEQTWADFQGQVAIINLVGFTIGLSILVWWARPLLRALRTLREGTNPEPEVAAEAVVRGVALGHRMTPLVVALWQLGGIAFPIWWHMQSGLVRPDAYLHFGVSNLFFGILAANLTFFSISWLVVRALAPALLGPDVPHDRVRTALRRLDERADRHFSVSMCVPFACLIVLAVVPAVSRGAFLALGLMGVASFGAAFAGYRRLQRMSAALQDL